MTPRDPGPLPNIQVTLKDGRVYQYWDCKDCYVAMPLCELLVSGSGYLKFFPLDQVDHVVCNPYTDHPCEVPLIPF